jgi:Zn-dependent protease
MMELTLIQKISIYALPVIFAITLHEAAHGYVARYFGDLTAYQAGRISLNPIRHIDPIGTILLPLITLMIGGILFGWAKPVPVNFGRLRHPKQDMLWVAAAGPAANLAMALFWAIIIKIMALLPENSFSLPLTLMGQAGIIINVLLLVLNLLPIPPLDGGRIAVSLLPHSLAYRFEKVEPYGFVILIVLLFSGLLGKLLWPFILTTQKLVTSVVGI